MTRVVSDPVVQRRDDVLDIEGWWLDIIQDETQWNASSGWGKFDIRKWLKRMGYGKNNTQYYGHGGEVWEIKKDIFDAIKLWVDTEYADLTLKEFLIKLGVKVK